MRKISAPERCRKPDADHTISQISTRPGPPLAPEGVALAGAGLDRRRRCGQLDQFVAVQEPQEPSLIDPREGLVAVATKQVDGSPAELDREVAEGAIEEPTDIVDEVVPAAQRHAGERAVRVEPTEALGPSARNADLILGPRTWSWDRAAFFLGGGPGRHLAPKMLSP
jgi:hypothetical protein